LEQANRRYDAKDNDYLSLKSKLQDALDNTRQLARDLKEA